MLISCHELRLIKQKETRSNMKKFTENIDRFVDANVNDFTDEQKKILKDFFNSHPQLNGKGDGKVDWQKEGILLTWEDFQNIMDAYNNRKTKRSNGLNDLKEGVDYKIVYNDNGIIGYEVLTYNASCILASNDVAPEVWSDVDKWYREMPGFKGNVAKDFPMKKENGKVTYGGAKWCTAFRSSSKHWEDYKLRGDVRFIYLIGNVPTGKVAITFLPKNHYSQFYDAFNSEAYVEELNKRGYQLIDDAFTQFPPSLTYRQGLRSIWNAYNQEVSDDPEYTDVVRIADELIGCSVAKDGILFFMYVIGAVRDGKGWSKKKPIKHDKTANFIKEHHMSRRYMVKEGKLRAKWNYWEGDFDCTDWGLETLENMPKIITGDFICKHNLEDFTEDDIPEGTKIYGRKIFE